MLRTLGLALPDNIGIHFPTSTVTADTALNRTLAQEHKARLTALGTFERYSSIADTSTVFFVDDLGKKVREIHASTRVNLPSINSGFDDDDDDDE